ncbi:MAG: hypothetical protein ACT4P3_05640 [Betaproteobacteria bacterium]
MLAVRNALLAPLLALACAASAAAQEMPSAELMREVDFRRNGALLPAPLAVEESRRAVAVLRAYAATGDETYFRDALRRARHLAALDPRQSSLADSLSIAWALALAAQWLAPRLDAAAERSLLEPLRARAATLFANAWPESLPALAVIARTLAGRGPQERFLKLQPGRETS